MSRYRPPSKAELEAIMLAGSHLSNIAFNLKQAPGRALSAHDCELMRKSQAAWDDARARYFGRKP